MREVPGTGTSGIYDEVFTVGVGGLAINDTITLPNSGTYESIDLEVYYNGQFLEEGQDYSYVGVNPRTQIQVLQAFAEGEELRFRNETDAAEVYDEVIVVGVGGLAGSSLVTLPGLKTYTDKDLKVYLDGQLLEVVEDYNYVGVAPRTQIQTVFDLNEGERLRLRIEG